MTRLHQIAPSSQSLHPLEKPVTVLNRQVAVNSVIKRHRHLWGQFIYASKGVLAVNIGNERYIVPPEQGVWVPPQITHQVTALTQVTLTGFYLELELLSRLPPGSSLLAVSAFLKALICEARNIPPDYAWRSPDGRLLRLIVDQLAIAKQVALKLPYPRDLRLMEITRELQQNPGNGNSLEQWGSIVGASARTLSRLFKKETGMSYSQWKQKLNLQLAITALAEGQSITNIALNLGYDSPSAFIYMFKKHFGISPKKYLAV
ncbi:helix-turn-helix domain-containing protein [Thalassomonas haliotis]|uniref:Helix-turn-helix transcriptional regulator n=1 Tax=Thalassomonas haliotis TaxID=485448 RepID=A0ABY7VAL3_9GAMM|nr:helix-turn-helix transcriptional regulator [Thalassomonas haliotis]WDE10576.1 helix-turn-helix transcriptional regulator [Thalassomonas haliotis]